MWHWVLALALGVLWIGPTAAQGRRDDPAQSLEGLLGLGLGIADALREEKLRKKIKGWIQACVGGDVTSCDRAIDQPIDDALRQRLMAERSRIAQGQRAARPVGAAPVMPPPPPVASPAPRGPDPDAEAARRAAEMAEAERRRLAEENSRLQARIAKMTRKEDRTSPALKLAGILAMGIFTAVILHPLRRKNTPLAWAAMGFAALLVVGLVKWIWDDSDFILLAELFGLGPIVVAVILKSDTGLV